MINTGISRRCDGCGKSYFRVNKVWVWTTRNVGHRAGWIKDQTKLCCTCFNLKDAAKVMQVVTVKPL